MTLPFVKASRPRRRTIALFPGAFQPPHEAHLAAARYLASRPDVDEVVIIITNRCRGVPGTTLSLDARVSERIWQVYLAGVGRTRVEIAPHAAVAHALSYIERGQPGDRLLFCIGEQDLAEGDTRFDALAERAERAGVQVEIVSAPTAEITVRATALRKCIARGEDGRSDFLAGLPTGLSTEQRAAVWQACRDGLREVSVIVAEKLSTLVVEADLGDIASMECINPARMDPVYRLSMRDGRLLFARYAGDAIESAEPVAGLERKPRRGLKVERRAIERLVAAQPQAVELPGVAYFERKKGVLLLDYLYPQGTSLAQAILHGESVLTPMARAAQFLAHCHQQQPAPFRNDAEDDTAHWAQTLARCCAGADLDARAALSRLAEMSASNVRPAFMHLNVGSGAVRLEGARVGMADFEHCTNIGDPAFDLGQLVGDCLADGLQSGQHDTVLRGAEAALNAYTEASGSSGSNLAARALAFAGARLLRRSHSPDCGPQVSVLRATGARLLASGLGEPTSVIVALRSEFERG